MNNCFSPVAQHSVVCALLLATAFAGRAQADDYAKSFALTGRPTVQVEAQWGLRSCADLECQKGGIRGDL